MRKLCFVLMPFGKKKDSLGRDLDFDDVYQRLIAPAVAAADLDIIRADEEQFGGTIHKPMFERLMLCEFAIADVTGANPNVYYELGVRHALRPHSTVLIFEASTTLPFDVAALRGLPYTVDGLGKVAAAQAEIEALAAKLGAAHGAGQVDSPVFEIFTDLKQHDVDHAKTDSFRAQATYTQRLKDELALARSAGIDAVRTIADSPAMRRLSNLEVGVVIDLFLSLRAVKAHAEMVALYDRMSTPLQRTRLVREQLAFALNRLDRGQEAERILLDLIKQFGPSSETNALLGRVYKDRWERALQNSRSFEADGLLEQAVEAYLAGFEADWRDAYPGVNAVTLMEMSDEPDPRQAALLPVVRYAAERRAARGGDYWDHATLLELSVLATDKRDARKHLGRALALMREPWEAETTARNLRLIQEVRARRGTDAAWITALTDALVSRASPTV